MSVPERIEALKHWLENELNFTEYTFKPASTDASFRRYFRVTSDGASFIVMDAPPAKEDTRPFVNIARMFFDAGLNVPEVIDASPEQGFLLLSDLGTRQYLDELNDDTVGRLYADALGALVTIQGCVPESGVLPDYDRELLMTEMGLFRDWLVGTHLGIELTDARSDMLDEAFDLLAENALSQPQVCVHRDYHSRNLMVTDKNNPGILDFQDAVMGPVTYDLVSLLRDCYIQWPPERVYEWASGYQALAMKSGVLGREYHDPHQFRRWFDLMGVQRHLKAAGIFARLNHRDGKDGYLADIPRTLGYVVAVADSHAELAGLGEFISREVLKRL